MKTFIYLIIIIPYVTGVCLCDDAEDCPIGDDSGRISSSEAYKIASEYTPKSHHFIQLMKNSHLTSLVGSSYLHLYLLYILSNKNGQNEKRKSQESEMWKKLKRKC